MLGGGDTVGGVPADSHVVNLRIKFSVKVTGVSRGIVDTHLNKMWSSHMGTLGKENHTGGIQLIHVSSQEDLQCKTIHTVAENIHVKSLWKQLILNDDAVKSEIEPVKLEDL